MVGVEIKKDGSTDAKLLDHVLLGHTAIEARANVVSVLDASHRFTLSMCSASISTARAIVGGATGGLSSAMLFKEETVKEAPTTIAALVQVVAVESVLLR